MREAFIITPKGYDLHHFLVTATKSGMEAVQRGEILSIGEEGEYVDLTETPEVSEHFDEEEQLAISSCGPAPRFYTLRFYDPVVAARAILKMIPIRPDFVLDNDHGLLLPLDRFAGLYQARGAWDWSSAERP